MTGVGVCTCAAYLCAWVGMDTCVCVCTCVYRVKWEASCNSDIEEVRELREAEREAICRAGAGF